MPLATREDSARAQGAGLRRPSEIDALVAYVGIARRRPAVPDVDLAGGDLAAGGELFRANCQPATAPPAPAAPSATAGPRRTLRAGRRRCRWRRPSAPGPGQMPVFGPDGSPTDEVDRHRRATSSTSRTPTTGAACRSAGSARSPRASWPGSSASARCSWPSCAWIGTPVAGREDARRRSDATAEDGRRGRRRRAGSRRGLRRQHRRRRSALAVVYWPGGQPQLEGVLLARRPRRHRRRHRRCGPSASCPHDESPRSATRSRPTEEEVDAFREELERGERIAHPAHACSCAWAPAAVAALGAALLFPIRSLGPRPGKGLKRPPYRRRAIRLVTDGRRAGAGRRPAPSTASSPSSPRATPTPADAPTLLIRTAVGPSSSRAPGREDWTVDGVVAYSKLCTHVGLPGRALPGRRAPAAVPVPPVDLRRARRRPPGVRPRRPVAAPAPARASTTTATSSPRATSPTPSGPASGTGTGDGAATGVGHAAGVGPLARRTASARAKFARTALDKVFPDHWSFLLGELALYCFVVLLADRRLPDVLLRPQHRPRSSTTAATRRCGAWRCPRPTLGPRPQLRRAGRAGHAPDPPLGRAAVPRRRSSCTSPGCSSPAPSAGPASSTG